MDFNIVLQYLGLSGSAAVGLGVLWYIVRRIIRSKCIRGTDGSLHLDLSFNTQEIATIQNDEHLRTMLQELRGEIARRTATPSGSPTNRMHTSTTKNDETRPVVVVQNV